MSGTSGGSSVIREFLVKLGFKVDSSGEQNFNKSLRNSMVQANLLADSLEAVAKKVFNFAKSMSQSLENLYWMSARTNVSVQNIQAMGNAFSQAGSSAEELQSIIENLSEQIQRAPGWGALLKSLTGVESAGHNLDQVLEGLAKRWSTMWSDEEAGRSQALAEARTLGISANAARVLATQYDNLAEKRKQQAELAKRLGLDTDAAAKKAMEFQNKLRDTSMVWNTVVMRVGDMLLDKLNPALVKFNDYLISHQDEIAKYLTDLWHKFQNIWTAVDHLVQSFGGWERVSEALFVFWTGAKALAILNSILKMGMLIAKSPMGMVLAGLGVLAGAALVNKNVHDMVDESATAAGYTKATGPNTKIPGTSIEIPGTGNVEYRKGDERLNFTQMRQKLGISDIGVPSRDTPGFGSNVFGAGAGGTGTTGTGASNITAQPLPTGGQSAFYNETYNNLLKAAKDAGMANPEVVARIGAAQASHETGHGQHIAPNSNNIFGIKARQGDQSVEAATTEVVNGQSVRTTARFAAYPTREDAARGYIATINRNPAFKGVVNAQSVPEGIASLGSYATDQSYRANIAIMHNKMSGGVATPTSPAPAAPAAGAPAPDSWEERRRKAQELIITPSPIKDEIKDKQASLGAGAFLASRFGTGDPLTSANLSAANNNNVNMAQNTTITVNGATDPHVAAETISRRQEGINTNLVRNMRGAIR